MVKHRRDLDAVSYGAGYGTGIGVKLVDPCRQIMMLGIDGEMVPNSDPADDQDLAFLADLALHLGDKITLR